MAALYCVLLLALLCEIHARPVEDAEMEAYKAEHPEEFGDKFEGDMVVEPGFRNGIINRNQLWPNGVVHYTIDRGFSSRDIANINAAIADYNRYTCIKWVKRTNQRAYVRIFVGGGCFSSIGMSGGRQDLSLGQGCTGKATVIHEMLHALGFVHEQSRTDRDDHIIVQWNNIQQDMRFNFNKHGSNYISLLNTPYDYGSVMQYGRKAFSFNGRDTMVPRRAGVAQLGQRIGFSKLDIERVNKLYSCQGGGGGVRPVNPPITNPCTDSDPNCPYWKSVGECYYNPGWMLPNCRRSCNQC
ncbi:zinc metalloproteinase nas-15-like [Lineus longissimus]|uniref:zinc metalloproteinase nas-15-like n=1 Tax=Lineus longissimus TaxID=88925 RepID=UPI002B4DA508